MYGERDDSDAFAVLLTLDFQFDALKRSITVSIVSDYGLDNRGSIPDRGRGFFL
jgi:hypothetical protein